MASLLVPTACRQGSRKDWEGAAGPAVARGAPARRLRGWCPGTAARGASAPRRGAGPLPPGGGRVRRCAPHRNAADASVGTPSEAPPPPPQRAARTRGFRSSRRKTGRDATRPSQSVAEATAAGPTQPTALSLARMGWGHSRAGRRKRRTGGLVAGARCSGRRCAVARCTRRQPSQSRRRS
jgi:hypothetical protein